MAHDVTIAVEAENISARKITKIIPLRDGFAVAVPYHNANRGWLLKMPVDYSKANIFTPLDLTTQYTLETKAKLSIHLSGFVHFSGKGIRSGYDPATGEAKGLGVKAPGPICIDGPIFAISVWGIEDFHELGDKKTNLELFRQDDFYFQGPADQWDKDGFVLEGFLMKWCERGSGVTEHLGRLVWRGYTTYVSPIRFRHELRVIDLPGQGHFIGIMVSRTRFHEAREAKSGFSMGGPSVHGPKDIWPMAIMAMYPYPAGLPEQLTTPLDYPA